MKDRLSILSHSIFTFFVLLLAIGTGCSLFLGNIKPVEEKAGDSKVMNLSSKNPDWVSFESKADAAYRSKRTGSTISMNSSCKSFDSHIKPDLRALTHELMLGITRIKSQKAKNITVQGLPALQTTTEGKVDKDDLIMRTVVVEKGKCVFDFIYISLADQFKTQESDFSDFVQSWKVN